MESANAKPGHYRVGVIENRPLSRRYYLLVLSRPQPMEEPGAGTFVHVMVPAANRFFLRRPFSVLDCDDRTISLIIVEKGDGTRIMRDLAVGDDIDIIGPLGNSFPQVPGKRVLALAGGVGLAPLYYYDRRRQARDCESYRLLYGARSRDDLFVDRFDWRRGAVTFSSDDGSYGHAGTVVELAQIEIERHKADVIFSCGPNPMLKAVARFAADRGLPHYVSLENRMACALGACRSCVVPVRLNGSMLYQTVCSDGPVFDADRLVWDKLPLA